MTISESVRLKAQQFDLRLDFMYNRRSPPNTVPAAR